MRPFSTESPFERAAVLDGVAQQVVGDVQRFFSRERLERAATEDERTRLAHELHDGVLQALAGIALQLQTATRLLDSDPETARARLREIQTLLETEQRELRTWIANLAPAAPQAMASGDDIANALQQLCRRAECQWRVRCELIVGARGAVPRTLADHVYRIVQEGLNNVGRHARAGVARVDLSVKSDRIDLLIADDGAGFPFQGTFDLAKLTAAGIGPRSLKDRVSALRGELVLVSNPAGSQLRISVPVARPGRRPNRSLASD
jgi:signal transduction histidine kinase